MKENTYIYKEPFLLESGSVLPGIRIHYHCSPGFMTGRKVVWICHALTANSNPLEWWPTMVGPGKFLDSGREYIVCANVQGSCYGSTQPHATDFPVITIRDMVKAHELLRLHLGIEHIDLLTGGSSGGFQALEWAIENPGLTGNLCLIACNARISPWATAFNESQRMALLADTTFGPQEEPRAGRRGLAAARSIALLSYRSYEGYCKTQSEQEDDMLMASKACSYQQYQGEKLADRFSPYSYYTLTLSLDSHNVGRNRGGTAKALSRIKARTLCIGIDNDLLFPISEMEILARRIPGAVLEVISSDFGHDGFLLEHEQITSSLCKFLNSEAAHWPMPQP
ncbi:MAG: alpha/beta fold hydrolase [Bacteroidales bacterium]|nr:alpha/beta fold hydrolase [Bacteroidales bacterium]